MDKHNNLLTLALILALALLSVTGYALVYSLTHSGGLEQRLHNQIIKDISQNKPKNGAQGNKGDMGEAGLTVQGPKGDTGTQGIQGIAGVQGAQGFQGAQGQTGATGPQGAKGDPGQPGQPGREVEFRCDPDTHDYEYRYVGDEGWTIIQPDSNTCKSTPL